MARYIDADELKESLKVLKAEGNNKKYVQGLQDAIDGYFPQIIDDVPTADVEPVRHGRWIECDYKRLEHGMIETYPKAGYACSVCRVGFEKKKMTYKQHCPHCGAKMEGEAK